MSKKDFVKLTPENFCYLSRCKHFMSDIRSTGCKLDYLPDNEDHVCPLVMERELRQKDPKWNPSRQGVLQRLREINEDMNEDMEMIKRMGHDAFEEAMRKCAKLHQEVYDAKIKYERLQYDLQQTHEICFGKYEGETK